MKPDDVMPEPTLRIEPGADGTGYALLLGGVDISDVVVGATVYLRARQRPIALLTVPLGSVDVMDADAEMDATTAAGLRRLGWRRPE